MNESKENPFTPGAGLKPPYLGGRDAVIDKMFRRSLDRTLQGCPSPKDIVIYGPRGVGKTCLISVVEDALKSMHETQPTKVKNRIRVVPLTAGDLRSEADIEIQLISLFGQSFWKKFIPEKAKINLLPLSVLYERKTTPFSQVREEFAKRSQRTPVVITIDEAHTLNPEIFRAISNHSAMIRKAGGALTVIFSGKPHLLYMASDSGASFGDRFEKLDIALLDAKATIDVIRIPFSKHGIDVDEEVLTNIANDTQGYPHFAQIWGERLWEQCRKTGRSRIRSSDYTGAFDEVREERKLLYGSRYRLWKGRDEALLQRINERLRALNTLPSETGVKSIIKEELIGQGRDADTFDEVFDKMIESDYVWQPQGQDAMSFSLPSFVSHIAEIGSQA